MVGSGSQEEMMKEKFDPSLQIESEGAEFAATS